MLRIFGAAEEELANMSLDDFWNIKTVKQQLHKLHGFSVFRQQLLRDGSRLADDDKLDEPCDLQLIFLNFAKASKEQAGKLTAAAASGSIFEVEEML